MRFESGFLRTLDQLRFASTRTFTGSGRGERRGRHRGQGVEFADYRPYAQGDDFRHVDWKAYKRLNRLLLRLFDEDQDLRVYLFLDTSRSMAMHGKFDCAARLAAALCYVGLAHLDRVSLLPFSDQLLTGAAHSRPVQNISQVLEQLEGLVADGRTNLWPAVSEFASRPARPGVLVIISDFLDPSGCQRPLALLAARGHEVTAVHVVAREDRNDADEVDQIDVVDAETGAHRRIDVTPVMRASYARAWAEADADVSSACARARAAYLRADVSVPIEETVLYLFRSGRLLE
jgi:uncharacterized protein (DUF58 family)